MDITSVANFKGGTGKTQTGVNLAALLAREGQRTLLIDADPQHNSSGFYCPDHDGPTLTDVPGTVTSSFSLTRLAFRAAAFCASAFSPSSFSIASRTSLAI